MANILEQQYQMVKGSRMELLEFLETNLGDGLRIPVPAFNSKSIFDLLIHVSNTYRQWVNDFALKNKLQDADELNIFSIAQIRSLFAEVDLLVEGFIKEFNKKGKYPICGSVAGRQLSLSPLQLFTHVITHEFHHKGQILSMCRILGYIPPDTDIIRF